MLDWMEFCWRARQCQELFWWDRQRCAVLAHFFGGFQFCCLWFVDLSLSWNSCLATVQIFSQIIFIVIGRDWSIHSGSVSYGNSEMWTHSCRYKYKSNNPFLVFAPLSVCSEPKFQESCSSNWLIGINYLEAVECHPVKVSDEFVLHFPIFKAYQVVSAFRNRRVTGRRRWMQWSTLSCT